MKKRILAIATVICLASIAIIGGTLAYFTDNDTETNTFTVGSVDIDLIESQYHRVNAGKGSTTETEPISGGYLFASNVALEGTTENTSDVANSDWSGTYFSDEQIKNDAASYKTGYFAEKSEDIVPGRNIRKNPYIVNNGKNDAYVRLRALVPVDLFKVLDGGPSYWTTTPLNSGVITSKAVTHYNELGYNVDDSLKVTKDGKEYYQFDFTYEKPLKAGAMTFWNAWGNIAIDKKATAADLASISSFDIIFEADAIQAEGFANATDAFAAFDDAE